MGDRDALIVICWLAIFLLIFFECFYRKLKLRLGRDVEPPPGFNSVSTTEAHGGNVSPVPPLAPSSLFPQEIGNWDLPHYTHCIGTKFRPGAASAAAATASSSAGAGGAHYFPLLSFPQSSAASSSPSSSSGNNNNSNIANALLYGKDMYRLSMEDEDEEEPPPTYEEALSYAKLITKSEEEKEKATVETFRVANGIEGKAKIAQSSSPSPSSSSLSSSLSTKELTVINLEGVGLDDDDESDLEDYCSDEDGSEDEEESDDDGSVVRTTTTTTDFNNNNNNFVKESNKAQQQKRSPVQKKVLSRLNCDLPRKDLSSSSSASSKIIVISRRSPPESQLSGRIEREFESVI